MKTRIFNPIVIAALSICSLNVSAQNTRSMNVALKHDRNLLASAEGIRTPLVTIKDLENKLSKMAEYIKFNPGAVVIKNNEPIEEEIWTNVLEELKDDVKYTPTEFLLMKYEQEMLAEEIVNDLKPIVKYNPSESNLTKQYDMENEFTEIQKELETIVKYKPTSIP